ncbi:hypothetical protein GE115_05055 [Agromyces sp. CFH 90414]|uniref:C-type lysozyme inhibitor domain-containing protein n=1 Tax=Agromyces agglutinans TaxID=2662258 RepID=A0A6I2F3T6_9MICO|nr:hypothetical protein [Agromyces agglutinans]MRG59239.1 hypothetical protein [Agromyces agglutinans]
MPAQRRRITAILAAVPFVAVSVLGAAAAANATQPGADGEHKVAFCHATHSETNPYVYIETDNIAVVRAHFKHQDEEDVWPAFSYSWHGEVLSYEGSGNDAFIERGCRSGGLG